MTPDRTSVLRDAALIAALITTLGAFLTNYLVTRAQRGIAREQTAAEMDTAHIQAAGVLVGIAVQVLTSPEPTNAETREWARKVIDFYCPVPLTANVKLPVIPATGTASSGASAHGEATITPPKP